VSIERKVIDHFHADAARFDAIYDDRKGALDRFVDEVWRGVVRRRLVLTLEKLAPLEGRTVLDVGCGSGRYCLEYAAKGATRVLGIDFAPAMIERAKRLAEEAGVARQCEFLTGRFPEDVPAGTWDVSTALGFFDYIPDPERMVAAMRERTRSTMVMSFPKAWEWRVPVRWIRFRLLDCPLFLYTRGRAEKIVAAAGIRDAEWIELDRDYLVIAHL
jgi:2-polyprenyl-3-methyl-5-hydroxy-6-metoxy-1,4-benzoquinol methylase